MRGPLPSHRPMFPSTFLEEAEKIAHQRTVPYQLRQRAALVLLLSQQPLGVQHRGGKTGTAASVFRATVAPPLGPGGLLPGGQAGTGPQGRFFPLWTTHWSRR